MLRPVPARWFEVLVAQDDCAPALAALAATGAVELESRVAERMHVPVTDLREPLAHYAELAGRFAAYWPAPHAQATARPMSPRDVLLRALGRLSAWHATIAPVVRTLQSLEHELGELEVWRELLGHFRTGALDFGLLAQPGAQFVRRVYVFAEPVDLPLPTPALGLWFTMSQGSAVLLAAPPAAIEAFHRQATALKGRPLELPRWLHGRADESLTLLERRRGCVERGVRRLRAAVERVNALCELPEALADIERLRWFAEQVERLPASDHFAWISGWSSESERALRRALERVNARALMRFPPPPADVEPPLVLRNPWWVRPFELFARALGVPGRTEVDPSLLLAFVVPLLFGYMFADVGHGLVLLAVGLIWGKRLAALRLLVPGGASAMVFGALFGSIFSREDLAPALWLHPLGQPLTVLGLPLVFGALLLALGLALGGVQAHWRRETRHWWSSEVGLLAMYVGALLGVWRPFGWWVAAAGLAWFLVGGALHARSVGEWLRALGGLVEHTFQLAVNTLSFARVGAFALAHAGLSSAIVVLAEASGNRVGAAAIMLVGNVIVLVLEGLVVSIQTTRLVLFEFFVRFLQGTGRSFRPLPAPPTNLLRRYA